MIKSFFAVLVVLSTMIGVFSFSACAYYIPVRVSGVTATSCPEEHKVSVDWNSYRYAEKYEIQISRSAGDWTEADTYTLSSTYTSRIITFDPYSAHRVVDYLYADVYYVRVRAVVYGFYTPWSKICKTEIVERPKQELPKWDDDASIPNVQDWFRVRGIELP